MTHHDDAALTAAAHQRPGYAVYPAMLRPASPSQPWRPAQFAADDAIDLAERVGLPLDEWQKTVLRGAFAASPPLPAVIDETHRHTDEQLERAAAIGRGHTTGGRGARLDRVLIDEIAPLTVEEILREHLPAIGEALTAALATPRRRWWHRLTRR